MYVREQTLTELHNVCDERVVMQNVCDEGEIILLYMCIYRPRFTYNYMIKVYKDHGVNNYGQMSLYLGPKQSVFTW